MSDIKTIPINNIQIKKAKSIKTIDPDKIKGYEFSRDLYSNIFICSKKKSGKTTLLYNMLKNFCNKSTIVYFFVPTIEKDDTYKDILDYLDKRKIIHYDYMSIYDNKKDILDEIIAENLHNDEDDEEKIPIVLFNNNNIIMKIRKDKKQAPKIIFVFDDISSEIRNNTTIRKLLKMNRHLKSKVIISSQYPNDLYTDSRCQIGIWILFGGHPEDKLHDIYKSADVSMPFEDFYKLYKYATSEKYNFFYIDTVNNEYRKNINLLMEI